MGINHWEGITGIYVITVMLLDKTEELIFCRHARVKKFVGVFISEWKRRVLLG